MDLYNNIIYILYYYIQYLPYSAMCESHFLIVTYCDAAPHYLPRRKARIRGQNFYPTPMLILVRAQAEKKAAAKPHVWGGRCQILQALWRA